MNFYDDDGMTMEELRNIVFQGGKRTTPAHINPQEEDFLKSLGNPGAIDSPFAEYGRNGDTEIALLNTQEQKILKKRGGSGTINPKTKIREYADLATAQIGTQVKPVDLYSVYYTPEVKAAIKAKYEAENPGGFKGFIGSLGGYAAQIATLGGALGGKYGQIVNNIATQFSKDPLWFAVQTVISSIDGIPTWALPVATTVHNYTSGNMSWPDAVKSGAISYASTEAGKWAVGSAFYKNNVSSEISKLLDGYEQRTVNAYQSITANATSSAVSSLVNAKFNKSKDPWGDMLKGGLYGGVNAGSAELIGYLTKDSDNPILKSNTFKEATSTLIASKLLKKDQNSTNNAVSGVLLKAIQKYIGEKIKEPNKTALQDKYTEQQKAQEGLDNYTQTTMAPLFDKQTAQVEALKSPEIIQASLDTYNARLDDIATSIYNNNGSVNGVYITESGRKPERWEIEAFLETKQISFVDPTKEKDFLAASSTLNNDFLPLYNSGQWQKDIDTASANLKQTQTELETAQKGYSTRYLNFVKADTELNELGATFLETENYNTNLIGNTLNAATLYKEATGNDLSVEKFEGLVSAYDPSNKNGIFIYAVENLVKKDYKEATGKLLTDQHWNAIFNQDKNVLTEDDVRKIYAQEGITNPTQEQIDKYAYDSINKISIDQNAIDKSSTSNQEIQEYFLKNLERAPTQAEIDSLLGNNEASGLQKMWGIDAGETNVTEAINIFKNEVGRAPTEEEITTLVTAGNETAATTSAKQYDSQEISYDEAVDYAKNIYKTANPTPAQIQEIQNLGTESAVQKEFNLVEKYGIADATKVMGLAKQFSLNNVNNATLDLLAKSDIVGMRTDEANNLISILFNYANPNILTDATKLKNFIANADEIENLDLDTKYGTSIPPNGGTYVLNLNKGTQADRDASGLPLIPYGADKGKIDTSKLTMSYLYDSLINWGVPNGYSSFSDNEYVDAAEAKAALIKGGIANPTSEQIAMFTKKNVTEADVIAAATKYGDAQTTTGSEISAAYTRETGSAPTTTVLSNLLKLYADKPELDALDLVKQAYDPLYTSKEEVEQQFAKYGISPTAADYTKFVGAKNQSEVNNMAAIDTYVNPRIFDDYELKSAVEGALGRKINDDELAAYRLKFGGGSSTDTTFQKNQQALLTTYLNDKIITPDEFTAAFKAKYNLTPDANTIAKYTGEIKTGDTQANVLAKNIIDTNNYFLTKDQITELFKQESGGIAPDSTTLNKLYSNVPGSAFTGGANVQGTGTEGFENYINKQYDYSYTTEQEVKDTFAKYGLAPTAADLTKYVGAKTEGATLQPIDAYYAPRVITKDDIKTQAENQLGRTLKDYEIEYLYGKYGGSNLTNANFKSTGLTNLGTYLAATPDIIPAEQPPVVEPENPIITEPEKPPVVTPPVEPEKPPVVTPPVEPEKPVVTPPVDPNPVEPPPTDEEEEPPPTKEPVYTYAENGDLYKDGVFYRAAQGMEETGKYFSDSKGNLFKQMEDGTYSWIRGPQDSIGEGEVKPEYDPKTGAPVIYKPPVKPPVTPPVKPPVTPPVKPPILPNTPESIMYSAFAGNSAFIDQEPTEKEVVKESPYFDFSKKFDPNLFNSPEFTNAADKKDTNQGNLVTMYAGGYLSNYFPEEPMTHKDLLNLLKGN